MLSNQSSNKRGGTGEVIGKGKRISWRGTVSLWATGQLVNGRSGCHASKIAQRQHAPGQASQGGSPAPTGGLVATETRGPFNALAQEPPLCLAI